MKKIIYSDDRIIGKIITNRSLTKKEALWALGYDIDNQKDCEKAYHEGWGYLDDEGNYFIDIEAIILK